MEITRAEPVLLLGSWLEMKEKLISDVPSCDAPQSGLEKPSNCTQADPAAVGRNLKASRWLSFTSRFSTLTPNNPIPRARLANFVSTSDAKSFFSSVCDSSAAPTAVKAMLTLPGKLPLAPSLELVSRKSNRRKNSCGPQNSECLIRWTGSASCQALPLFVCCFKTSD